MVRAVAVLFSGCYLIPFRTAVSFWRQSTQILSSFSSKRDCGTKRVNRCVYRRSGRCLMVAVRAEVIE